MPSSVRIGAIILSLLAALAVSGCAELFEATSTWPETESPADAALKDPLPSVPPTTRTPTPPVEVAPAPAQPEIFRGTGRFVNTPKAHAEMTDEGDITLNFADADIREVVRVILGDILQQNYVIDPSVQGTISIETTRPLAQAALLPTLETLLELNGAALVSTATAYKVLPIPQAPRETNLRGVGNLQPPQRRGYGIQIVPLRYVSAGEMVKVLTPIVEEASILYVDRARNLLLLGGTRGDLENILETIALFDVDWLQGMSFGFFPMQNAEATAVVEELQAILAEGEEAPLADLLRFVPVERLNAVIVISSRPAYIDKAGVWIARLDRASELETPRLFVYYVQNKRAADLAETLSQIFISTDSASQAAADSLRPGLEPIGLRSTARATETAGSQTTGTSSTNTQAGTTGTTSSLRSTTTASGATLQISGGQTARIIADETNNALIILATPADYRMLEAAIKKLDLIPLQVLIEATIAEVRLRDELEYGLQWFFASGNNSVALSEGTTAAVASLFPGFSYVFASSDVRVVLNALDSITDVNVISSPQVLVLDNESATLQVGDEVPVATQSAVSTTDPGAPIVNQIEQRDTGVILTVTPRVNAGGLVTLEIEQEISDVVPTISSGIDSPTIRQRRIETTVAMQSGETVALGGLIRETRDRTKAGVPILHELPVVGSLFGATGDTKERTELLVVITPRVIRSREDARQMTDDLRKRLRSVSPLDRRIR